MAQKDKIELRRTTWFVVNIKARKNQNANSTSKCKITKCFCKSTPWGCNLNCVKACS